MASFMVLALVSALFPVGLTKKCVGLWAIFLNNYPDHQGMKKIFLLAACCERSTLLLRRNFERYTSSRVSNFFP